MPIFDGNLPYTNLHSMNLDWVLETVGKIKEEWENFGYSVTASAVAGAYPNVEVTGDLVHGLNFKFTLVKGDKGDTGAKGEPGVGITRIQLTPRGYMIVTYSDGTNWFSGVSLKGEQGEPGEGLELLDIYPTLADLQTAHPTGHVGDLYLVGVSPNYELYLWSATNNSWEAGGRITSPSPSATVPLMDGEASTGSEVAYARGDHVHPSDSTKASLQQVYPVGSIYMNANVNTNPATLFGFGNWTQLKDTFLLACGDSHARGETGGEELSVLTESNLPHQSGYFQVHGGGGGQQGTVISGVDGTYFKTSTSISNYYRQGSRYSGANSVGDVIYDNHGNSDSFSNMPPYIAVYVWVRTE